MSEEQPRYKTLSNGAVYDMQVKRIVSGAVLTSEGARQLKNADIQRKRDLLAAGAMAAVEDQTTIKLYGSDAWLYEIGKAQTIKATTPDDPKSTDAARFMVKETGRGEQEQAQQAQTTDLLGRVSAVAALVALAVADGRLDVDTIEAETVDTDGGGDGVGGDG